MFHGAEAAKTIEVGAEAHRTNLKRKPDIQNTGEATRWLIPVVGSASQDEIRRRAMAKKVFSANASQQK